jgi:hypothetical protein
MLICLVNSSTLIDTNQRVSDLQFSQIMASLSNTGIWDPNKAFQYHRSTRQRCSRRTATQPMPDSFWKSPKLLLWSSTDESALTIVSSTFRTRFALRNMCVGIIEQLQNARVPYLLAMKVPEKDASTDISANDLLRYLARQAIQLKQNMRTEKSMSLTCVKCHGAANEAECFQLLEATLAEIGSLVYIVVDLEIIDRKLSSAENFSWVQAFERFFEALVKRGLSTKLKVLLVSYGSLSIQLSKAEYRKLVIYTKTRTTTARQRKFSNRLKVSGLQLR